MKIAVVAGLLAEGNMKVEMHVLAGLRVGGSSTPTRHFAPDFIQGSRVSDSCGVGTT